jgi:hypothetical protein
MFPPGGPAPSSPSGEAGSRWPSCRCWAAGPALRKSRESCNEPEPSAVNHQRIDRPLLPERPPSGRLVSGTRGQAGVCGDLWPGRVSASRTPATSADTGWSLRQPPRTSQLVWRAAGHGSGTAATAGHSRVQTRWAWSVSCRHGDPDRPCGNRSGLPQTSPDTSAVAVRRAVQVPDTHERTAASGVCGGYRNRSPGWRPLVGCSQRRWTRPSRAVRRPRSWPRT